MDVELKPCPFCGKTCATVTNTKEMERPSTCFMYTVVCDATQDGCGTTMGYAFEKDEAIAAWNHRHSGGDGDRSAELTTAWMAGAESVRDQAERDAEDSARLDWAEKFMTDAHFIYAADGEVGITSADYDCEQDGGLRSFIDAARAGERG